MPLTKGLYTRVDFDDYEYLMQWTWHACYAKTTGKYYAGTNVQMGDRRQIPKVHHIIFNDVTLSPWDHIDHDPLNNTRRNLRKCTYNQNCSSRGMMKNNTSGYRGVTWNKARKRWKVYIGVNRKSIYVGDFKNKQEAALAYDQAAMKYHGQFAGLNFPNGA